MNYLLGYVLVYVLNTGDIMAQRNETGATLYKSEIHCIKDAIKSNDLGMPSQCVPVYGAR